MVDFFPCLTVARSDLLLSLSLPPSLSLSCSPALPPSLPLPLSRPPSLPLSPTLPPSLSLSRSPRPPSLPSPSPSLPLSLYRPPSLSLLPLSLSVDLFFYDVAATWISLGLLGCQLDREESTIAAVLDLDKKLRVGARFGEYESSC